MLPDTLRILAALASGMVVAMTPAVARFYWNLNGEHRKLRATRVTVWLTFAALHFTLFLYSLTLIGEPLNWWRTAVLLCVILNAFAVARVTYVRHRNQLP